MLLGFQQQGPPCMCQRTPHFSIQACVYKISFIILSIWFYMYRNCQVERMQHRFAAPWSSNLGSVFWVAPAKSLDSRREPHCFSFSQRIPLKTSRGIACDASLCVSRQGHRPVTGRHRWNRGCLRLLLMVAEVLGSFQCTQRISCGSAGWAVIPV